MREDWIEVELGEVCNVYPGIGFPKTIQGKKEGKYPFFKVGDISKNVQAGNRKLIFCDNYIDDGDIKNIKSNILPANTIVFAKIGEALKLNRRCITSINCLIDNNAIGIKAKSHFDDLYLYFYSLTIKLENYSRATTVPSVRKSDIEEITIPLAPLPVQRAIVQKIENLFTSLDKGIADLKTAQEQLKIYRQAVLKKAFEGGYVFSDPKNWEYQPFKECLKFSQGIQIDVKFQSELKKNSQVRFLRIIDFTQGDEPERYINNPGEKYIVKKEDISLVRYGASTGYVCSNKEGAIANNLFQVIP